MTIYEKLINVQNELKAPKSQYNSFGKYSYRNCEDILEALKPILLKHKAAVIITDEVVFIEGRFYIKATAKFIDIESSEIIESVAYAREEESKKGMDCSQVTGASSSYARKYSLNGMFCIDDTKDADTLNTGNSKGNNSVQTNSKANNTFKLSEAQIKRIKAINNKAGYTNEQLEISIMKKFNKKLEELTKAEYDNICSKIESKIK